MPATKVATCCYCGTRAALVLRGRERHELACSSCGAPLHEMKQLHPARPAASATTPARPAQRQRVVPYESHDRWTQKKPRKKKRSLGRRIFNEVLDLIEDIID
jgi:recombinational DNA repair protein (RecF pathway)